LVGGQIVIYHSPFGLIQKQTNKQIPLYTEIRGVLIVKDSEETIPYANVCIVGHNIGTITNNEGEFIIKIHSKYSDEFLGFSCIGYKTVNKQISELENEKDTIYLSAEYIPIQEVIIRYSDPVYLIKNAKYNISKNYCNVPSLLTAFYRETIQKNNNYVAVMEALLYIYKGPYSGSYRQDQVKIHKSRKTYDTKRFDTLAFKLKGGLRTGILLDVAKKLPNFLDEEYFEFYDYSLSDIILIDDKPAYVIDFDQKISINYPLFKGKIYIDLNTLAIRSVEFTISPSSIENASQILVLKKPRKTKIKALGADYLIRYREVNGKYFLSHIKTNVSFRVRKRKKLFGSVYSLTSEIAVNEIDTTDIKRFKLRDIANTHEIFEDQISEYTTAFWGDFNYIKPEQPLIDAITRLNDVFNENQDE